ncbi:MAG: tRNA (adenosine(37)-N6)-dimethylallyltransferase MiaA [Rickettsiales bacterium]
MHKNRIIVLMGPTGAGKSALALEIAASRPSVIINADAMQMVSSVRVITARPTVEEEGRAEHALYGVLQPQEPTSVAVWLKLVEPTIRTAWEEGKLPLLIGGTGMYIKALMDGLAVIPPIPDDIRTTLRALDAAEIRIRLEVADPTMAAQLKPGDSQRNLRALEVWEATGTSLSAWQEQAVTPLFPEIQFQCFAAMHPREEIYRRIDARFETMMNQGALDEVSALMNMNLSPELPILRAHGVPELMAHLRGEMALDEAIAKAQKITRNYAKRQMTWLRNQLSEALEVQAVAPIMASLN